jgi:hypothetical protein
MSPEEFVDSRSNLVDADYVSSILTEKIISHLGIASLKKIISINNYSKLDSVNREQLKKIANSVVRAALSDLYNKMNPEHFEGYPDARKVAEKLYDEFFKKYKSQHGMNLSGYETWELAGAQTQDAWIAVAILSQKIWEEQTGVNPNQPEKETGTNWKAIALQRNEEIHRLNEKIDELSKKNLSLVQERDMLQTKWDQECSKNAQLQIKLTNAGLGHVISEEKMPDTAEQAREIRGNQYGHFHPNHEQVGQIWGGILSAHFGVRIPNLPASLVELMMVGLKLWRIAKSPLHLDSQVDAQNYLNMVPESQGIEAGEIADPTLTPTAIKKVDLELISSIIPKAKITYADGKSQDENKSESDEQVNVPRF